MSHRREEYSGDYRRNIEHTTAAAQAALSAPAVQRDSYEDPPGYLSYGFWAPTGTGGAGPSGAGQVYSGGALHPSWAYEGSHYPAPARFPKPDVTYSGGRKQIAGGYEPLDEGREYKR